MGVRGIGEIETMVERCKGEKEGRLEGRGSGSMRVGWGYGLSVLVFILALQTNQR
jgi:hypothetical protein